MEFDGTFGLEDVTSEEVWLALSDPIMVKNALPGCQFLVEVDDPEEVDFDALAEAAAERDDPPTLPEADPEEVAARGLTEGGHYAALVQVGVGSVKPRFETVVTIDRREFPEMDASGQGSASDSSFEMESGMTLVETDDGVDVEWWTEADVFGRVAQMGQRVINPVANRVVGRFFKQIQTELSDVGGESSGLRDRISNFI
jgi:carbon monoxide dehydrogenase subunit G